jgi:hypothetical protein
MSVIALILYVFAFVLLIVEAFRPAAWAWPAPHLGWLGLAIYVLAGLLASTGVLK